MSSLERDRIILSWDQTHFRSALTSTIAGPTTPRSFAPATICSRPRNSPRSTGTHGRRAPTRQGGKRVAGS
jgi:hypothetical protein